MSEQWRVGDKVRLTGYLWGAGHRNLKRGSRHTVVAVTGPGYVEFEGVSGPWYIYEGWEIELVERAEEKKMSINISEVNVGDRVKLTRENGDEATFTVERKSEVGMMYLKSHSNGYDAKDWDTLEVLEKKFELVPGLYANGAYAVAVTKAGKAYFHSTTWVDADPHDATSKTYEAVRQQNNWKRVFSF